MSFGRRVIDPRASFLGLGFLIWIGAGGSWAQTGPLPITLAASTSPVTAQPGVTVVTLTCSGLPSGTITAASLNVTLQPGQGATGPALTTQVSGFAALPVSGGRITFKVNGPNVSTPTPYLVSVSGSTATGTSFASSKPASLTINPPAQIVSIAPSAAQPGQTLQVTITGQYTNYVQGSTTAIFGPGVSVASLTVTSPTTATVQLTVAPAAAPGIRSVTVATGVQSATADLFSIVSPSALLSINPNTGTQGQSVIPVTITGQYTHFTNASVVDLGAGITVSSVAATDTTHLTAQVAIAANATAGNRSLTVTTGSEAVTLANAFTVIGAPALLSMNPNTVQQGQQNLSVTIVGQFTHFFQGTTTASFGAGITVTSVTVNSSASATAVLNIDPAATAGARNVTVTTEAEVVTLANGFSVTNGLPVLTTVNPNTGQQGQTSLAVTISGNFTHFTTASVVTFSGTGVTAGVPTAATSTSLTVPVTIAANAPLGAQGIQVVTGAETVSLANAFTVAAGTPVITLVNPNSLQ